MEQDKSVSHSDLAEIKELIHQTLAITEENNKILHAMRKWGRVAFVGKVLIWAIVLISPIFLYQYVVPFITNAGNKSPTALTGNSLFGLPSPDEIQKIIHKTQ